MNAKLLDLICGLEENIDEDKTAVKSKELLQQYRKLSRMAGKPLTDLKSPTLSDMPRGGNLEDAADRIIKRVDALDTVKRIDKAIDLMSVTNKAIIFYSYAALTIRTQEGIALKTNMALATFKRQRKDALIEFAECFEGGQLLVQK